MVRVKKTNNPRMTQKRMRARKINMAKEVFQVLTLSDLSVLGRESFLTTALLIPKSKTAASEIKEARKI
jgi:hypothetical protein